MFAAALGYASPSHAQVSSIFFTTQANCAQVAGSNATAFTPGGTPVTVSLCMTTSAATCGHSIILQSAVGESGNFVVTQRTLGSNYSEANALTDPLPLAINNPAAIADFGGTSTAAAPNVAIPASANQLLATFTIDRKSVV